ncbi:uncharacterized protein LOC108458634 [Gossypium arboreum]|uniref:uncharacterized protein LOC108458634 n=1 Tax=Gossypium arboreum TaxID=29729 RepID=UPI00081928C1|nr:uncharacterized protein LOC108458634 [Gossypium arboreum]
MEINNVAYIRIKEEETELEPEKQRKEEKEEEEEEENSCSSEVEFPLQEEPLPQILIDEKWSNRLFKFIAIGIPSAILVIIAIKWVGPLMLKKVIVPALQWEAHAFSTTERILVIVTSLALFPTLCLPSTPSMWMAGMAYGYIKGLLLVMMGVSLGVSLPFFVGSMFHTKIQRLLGKYPKEASILRLAGEGNLLHQFRTVTLIRISPLPYIMFNYAAVATNVRYIPYMMGTWVGMLPEVFIALYSGILIRSFAEATQYKRSLTPRQIIYNIVGFCASVTATIFIGIRTKKRLDRLQEEELIRVHEEEPTPE